MTCFVATNNSLLGHAGFCPDMAILVILDTYTLLSTNHIYQPINDLGL